MKDQYYGGATYAAPRADLGSSQTLEETGLYSSSQLRGVSSGNIKYNPLFKEVDDQLRKLRSQLDSQIQSTEVPRLQQRTFINASLIKPSTSKDLSESTIDGRLNFSTAPRVNSFHGFRGQKPSTGVDKSIERKYFKQDTSSTITKNDSESSLGKDSRLQSRNSSELGNLQSGSYGDTRKDFDTNMIYKPVLRSSEFLGSQSPPKPNNDQAVIALKVREREVEQKLKELEQKQRERKFREELEKEQKVREESIKKTESKRYADQEEKVTLLSKKVDSLNRENEGLKNEVAKLTTELKAFEGARAQIEDLHKAVLEREMHIQQLVRQVEDANEQIRKREDAIRSMQVETGNVKQIVYSDKSENAFNMAIRTSLEENQRIKEQASAKDEQIEHVRDLNKSLRSQVDASKNELQIQKLKHLTDVKNMQTSFDIEKLAITNEMSSMRKMVTVMDEKFKFLLKEERRKDEFMVGYFRGKIHDPNDKQLLVNFFKQFESVPKMTMSELLVQQHAIQEQLREQIKRLHERIQVDDLIHKQLRKQIDELQRRRY